MTNKTKHSFELFLTNRQATVKFIASAYTSSELADEVKLKRIFWALKQEFEGSVDLGLIDAHGVQISYAGPYDLKGKNYAEQSWFQQVKVNGIYISDVFMGFRSSPMWLFPPSSTFPIRVNLDRTGYHRYRQDIRPAYCLDGSGSESDGLILNREGVLQTEPKFLRQGPGTSSS